MRITPCVENKVPPPSRKRSGRVLQGWVTAASPAVALSVAIVFGSGCSGTKGFNVHLAAPVLQSSQSTEPADEGWYHPPESPGFGKGG
jgi:hypothetical protein